MAIEKTEERDAISFSYDKGGVIGEHATILAKNTADGSELEAKRKILNDGSGSVTFPKGHSGWVYLEVWGEDGGLDKGLVSVGEAPGDEPEMPDAAEEAPEVPTAESSTADL